MGWTYAHKPATVSVRDYLAQEFPSLRFLETARVGNVFYAAATEDGQDVFGLVCLLSTGSGGVFGYKDMDETMGPLYYDCPARVLDRLSPTTNPEALRWRARCREQAARIAKARQVTTGSLLRFEEPLRFTDGHVSSVFQVERQGRRTTFLSARNGRRYRIPNWESLRWEVLA